MYRNVRVSRIGREHRTGAGPTPTAAERKKVTGLGVVLAVIAVVVVVVLIGYVLWGTGEMPAKP
jgi:hypothetical protein